MYIYIYIYIRWVGYVGTYIRADRDVCMYVRTLLGWFDPAIQERWPSPSSDFTAILSAGEGVVRVGAWWKRIVGGG
jgi:hypothetical protein